jgi:hypothetical protein
MSCSVRYALVLSFLWLAPDLGAQPAPRRPRGIYAVVNIEDNVNQQRKTNLSITPAELNAYFDNLFQDLLNNPAISGLTLQVREPI